LNYAPSKNRNPKNDEWNGNIDECTVRRGSGSAVGNGRTRGGIPLVSEFFFDSGNYPIQPKGQ